MNFRKSAVYLMTAILVFAMILAELVMMKQEGFSFYVKVATVDGTETIKAWHDNGCYYVFLPSYADPNQAELVTSLRAPLWIQGERVKKGAVCGSFPFNEELDIRYNVLGEIQEEKVYFCQSGNVPTLYIDTASGTMDYIHEQKGNEESGKLRLYTAEGTLDANAKIQSIYGRGNSTWDPPKKPYSLVLNQREELLGMAGAKEWILLANYFDQTNMRNIMCYDFASAVGCAYTPECHWVDLYLNGTYVGLYLLSERNEVDSQRIDIPKDNSFLISREMEWQAENRNYSYLISDNGVFLRIRHAGIPEDKIWDIWQSVENAIYASDGVDPVTGRRWQDLIDMNSWAQQYLLWEVFADYDAGALSKFFYYDGNFDRVFGGPIWDMDNTLSLYGRHPPNVLMGERKYIWHWERTSLFYTLFQKEDFQSRVKELYRQLYRPLLMELVESGMDTYLIRSMTAANMNRLRWEASDPSEAIQTMKQYLKKRIAFLDDYWESEDDYCIIDVTNVSSDGQWRSFAVRRGETADFLPTYSSPWVDAETGEPFDTSAPVTRDRIIQPADYEEE